MTDKPIEWEDRAAYILPKIPKGMLEPELSALIHIASFIELSGDDAIDPDFAVEALEHMCAYLTEFETQKLNQIQTQLEQLAMYAQKMGWSGDAIEFIESFLENCGLFDEND